MINFLKILSLSDWITILLVTIILYISLYYYEYYTRDNPLPGPFPLPIIGSLYQNPGSNLAKWIYDLAKIHGEIFEIWVGPQRQIILSSAELIEQLNVPSTKSNFIIRYAFHEGLEAWGTDTGITFNRNIESWRFNRKYFDYAVTNPAYLYGTIERMQEYFKEMQGYWKELGSDCVLDLNAWIYHIASDIIFFNTTGRKFHFMAKYFNVLSTGKKIDIEDSHITEKIFKGFENAFKAIFFLITTHSLLRHTIYRKQNKEHLKAQDQLRRLLCELIQERRKEIENTPVDEPLKPDIMNLLITANTERDISHNTNDYLNRPLTDDAIQMSLFESIAASTSTSVAAFIFVVEYVGRHPEVEAKIRTEINSFFSDNPNRVVTYGNLNEFKYIEAVYYETTRINTAVPFMFRTNQREDVIAGYRWKPDTQFVVNYQAPHRNEKHFTDPEKFIPERFINDGSDEKGTFKKAFYPWGGGLHICPARNIGLAYVKMLLVLLYRNYEVKLVNADKPIQTYHDFITQCADTRAYLKPI